MTKYDWKNKEKFLIDLLNSKNRCDFLIKNNLTATSGNYNTIRKWLSYHDIKISSNKKEINVNNIFIENSFYNRGSVKKIIMKNNLIPYKCECCGNKGI